MNKLSFLVKSYFWVVLLVIGVQCRAVASEVSTSDADVASVSNDIAKSPLDKNKYRHITLKNGITILLISDSKTDKSAVAVDVNAGSFLEPDEWPGLAHFLEHMLFLGNEKYPNVDSYFEFIRTHGGSANAYTSDMRTQYYFDINSDKLEQAIDRLANFFVSPTLDRAYIDRERNAVDAEYRMHLKEDVWRYHSALSATANPKHPRSRFTIGSLGTLDNRDMLALSQALRSFYDKWYIGSNISVVVYGKESLDKLEQWVETSFRKVKSGYKPDSHIAVSPYLKDQLGVRINLIPLQDQRELLLSFPLPSTWKVYQKKPLNYIARLLGYEGKGSLHSLLIEKGWINSLSVGDNDLPKEYNEFTVQINLTKMGLEHVDEITALVFDYLALIRNKGITEALYSENANIAKIEFDYLEPSSPLTTVSRLASKMHYYPPERILDSGFVYSEFDANLIKSYLDLMVPSNLRQVVIAPQLYTDNTEPYFEVEYSISPLSRSLKKRLRNTKRQSQLSIPEKNSFIPDNLEVQKVEKPSSKPELIIDQSGLTVWHFQDNEFNVPKNNIRLKFSSEAMSKTPTHAVMLFIYKALLEKNLNEATYPAQEAGLGYGISATREGLFIYLSGYYDKQAILMDLILNEMKNLRFSDLQFNLEKANLERNLKNQSFDLPYKQNIQALSEVLFSQEYSATRMLKAFEHIDVDEFRKYTAQLFKNLHVDMLSHGNLNAESTKEIASMIPKILHYSAANRYSESLRQVAERKNLTVNLDIDHNDSTLLLYYQAKDNTVKTRASAMILGKIISTPFWNTLRTEQQLGYVAMAGSYLLDNWPSLLMVVQSPVAGPDQIYKSVSDFIRGIEFTLGDMTDEEIASYKNGIIVDLMKTDANLNEKTNRFWSEIEDGFYDFNEREELVAALKSITKSELISNANKLFLSENKTPVIIENYGNMHQDESYQSVMKDTTICKSTACMDLVFEEN